MKIKKLYIKKYKNIKNFKIEFSTDSPISMLVGNNGSGKSNILEVISAIFYDVYRDTNLFFSRDNEYELEYEINEKIAVIGRKNKKRYFLFDGKIFSRSIFVQAEYIPHNVICVYSGEEDRLWKKFYQPYYKKYISQLRKGLSFEGMKLSFINKFYWNIALLVMLISKDNYDEDFIKSHIGIMDNVMIKLSFNVKNMKKNSNVLLSTFIEKINPNNEEELAFNPSELSDIIFSNNDTDDVIFQYFIQSNMPKDEKIIKDIFISFNEGITSDVLSEGEKKIILIKAVLEFLSDERTLILLDEPDAHVNEGRKKGMYKLLSKHANQQIIMTTHSPTFIDLADQNQIIMLKNNNHGVVEIFEADNLEKIYHLTGSRYNAFLEKPILYCEGTIGSLDTKLYPILFPNYKVIPVNGHKEVISSTKMYNRTFGEKMYGAIGIIDQDYRSAKSIKELEAENIYCLNVLEIENVLMDEDLILSAAEQFYSGQDGINDAKNMFFKNAEGEKSTQSIKFASSKVVNEIKTGVVIENRDIDEFIKKLSKVCKEKIIRKSYGDKIIQYEKYIEEKCYSELVAIFDFNHSIDRFLNKTVVDNYTQRIIRLIEDRSDLQEMIKERYFSGIPENIE